MWLSLIIGSDNDDGIVSAYAVRIDVHNEDDVQTDCQLLQIGYHF